MPRPKGAIQKDREFSARNLSEKLKPIHKMLNAAGVKEADMPSNDVILGRMLNWLDWEKAKKWVADYAKVMK